jgi:hypothetical protein
MEKTPEIQCQTLMELAKTSLATKQQDTDMKQKEQLADKLESTPEDMAVQPVSTSSNVGGTDKLESTPGDMPVQHFSASSKLEDGHSGDKSEITTEGPLVEEEAAAVLSAQTESNATYSEKTEPDSKGISVSAQLPAPTDVIRQTGLMPAGTKTSETDKIDMKDIVNKLLSIKVALKEMKETILEAFPEKRRELAVAQLQQQQQQQTSGKQTEYDEKQVGLSNIPTATSSKPFPHNENQHSDKPKSTATGESQNYSLQKNMQQLEDSKNMEASCEVTSQQVGTYIVDAPEELEASPKNTTESSEDP